MRRLIIGVVFVVLWWPYLSVAIADNAPVVIGAVLVDINSAKASELVKIFSAIETMKVIDGRPWSSTEELVTKGIITEDKHTALQKVIIAKVRTSEKPIASFFFLGAEYTLESKSGQKNFAKPFPFIGLRVNTLADTRKADDVKNNVLFSTGKVRTQLDFRLVSTAVEKFDPTNPANTNLSAERSFDTNVALFWAPFILNINSSERVWEIGPVIKVGGQTSETEQNFFWRTMGGIRFMETGSVMNGTYFDVGYGYSGNFLQPKYRMKIEGFLPMYDLGVPLFLQTTLETDFGSKPDLVKIGFGTFFDSSQILDKLKKLTSG